MRDPGGLDGLKADKFAPLDEPLNALKAMYYGSKDELDRAPTRPARRDDAPLVYSDRPKSNVNPFRDVGRNDPCPCGSGKKYKKCCLAA